MRRPGPTPVSFCLLLLSVGFAGCVTPASPAWVDDVRAQIDHVEIRYAHEPDAILDVPFSWDADAAAPQREGAALADQLIVGVHAVSEGYKEVGLYAEQSRALRNASLYVRVQLDQAASVELPNRGITSTFDTIMTVYAIDPDADPRFVEDRGWTRHVITCANDHCSRGLPHQASQRHEATADLAEAVLERHGIAASFPPEA